MSRAVYTFFEKHSNKVVELIEFELLDNPGVKAWHYAVNLNNSTRICEKKSCMGLATSLPEDINQQFQTLIDTIKTLDSTDYAWKENVPVSFDQIDQDFLNRLHRHFTDSCYDFWDHRSNNIDNSVVNENLQNLNEIIHYIERYVPTDTKIKYCDTGTEIWFTSQGSATSFDLYPFRQYHSYEPADLILDSHILGKTLMESFACEDDPSAWDTNGHMRTNGGAVALLDRTRQDIYNGAEFETWLQKYGLIKESKLADFPLGNFVTGHKNKLELLQKDLDKFSVQLHIQQ